MDSQYYLIIAGFRNAKYTSKAVATAAEACEDVFGFTDPRFRCIPIGVSLPKERPLDYIAKNQRKLLKAAKTY